MIVENCVCESFSLFLFNFPVTFTRFYVYSIFFLDSLFILTISVWWMCLVHLYVDYINLHMIFMCALGLVDLNSAIWAEQMNLTHSCCFAYSFTFVSKGHSNITIQCMRCWPIRFLVAFRNLCDPFICWKLFKLKPYYRKSVTLWINSIPLPELVSRVVLFFFSSLTLEITVFLCCGGMYTKCCPLRVFTQKISNM